MYYHCDDDEIIESFIMTIQCITISLLIIFAVLFLTNNEYNRFSSCSKILFILLILSFGSSGILFLLNIVVVFFVLYFYLNGLNLNSLLNFID